MGLKNLVQRLLGVDSSGELEWTDEVVGDGPEAIPGRDVTVHYTGTLLDGSTFDSSRSRVQPFTFRLGAGRVIAGWEQGVEGMRVGGRRTLRIPPRLGYGRRGSPPVIPPNATLVLDIELLGVK